MRLVFAGTPEIALPALEALLESERHEVVAVVTRPDAPAGRGRRLLPSPVGARAAEAGLEVLKPAKARDPEFLDRLREIAPDACPVVAYGAILPQVALDIPRHGWINLHFSLLPAWRGAAPVQHAILHGDEITGATTFQIVKELDAGPVYGVTTETIRPTDTSGELLGRLAVSGAGLLAATLDGIADGALEARPQPAEGVSLAPKLEVDDARVDWTAPAMRVDRLIRACTPAPGAWTTFRDTRIKLGPVRPRPDIPGPGNDLGSGSGCNGLEPGRVAVGKNSVLIGTGTHPVELGEVQPQGKRRMTAAEWARGTRLTDDDRLA
ncbi:methionyl-tRNA formyltransferase [Bailinhaonella thermotolerans]|uniref:Methionyl-tRNA formyltransferase n=1 Tax=Bailinhaonella thermotolerans TaxID=1070861 RepID=A0A3A4AVJ5_9ACTN|nr:methionyl-tRNA formyltransferase [Bailinhaonella thermotolerans]RJL31344.1 methionyl-tRNA formyltransferase [Bailinhaonella thermotolerans]